jgi:hypothetical protein
MAARVPVQQQSRSVAASVVVGGVSCVNWQELSPLPDRLVLDDSLY